jgi:hypothetical protein
MRHRDPVPHRVHEAFLAEVRSARLPSRGRRRDRRNWRERAHVREAPPSDPSAFAKRPPIAGRHEGRRGRTPGRLARALIEVAEVREEILAAARVHQRMEPRKNQQALP